MKLYHGSSISGIARLKPFKSNHGKAYVYLTDSEPLAVIYAHNPLTRPNGWFTYRFGRDGGLNYDEYFDNALEKIYSGRSGYVYSCEAQLSAMEKMPWVYLSEAELDVGECRFIPDIYKELLALEKNGRIRINRYGELPEGVREDNRRVVQREIDNLRLREDPESEYARFIRLHFPEIF